MPKMRKKSLVGYVFKGWEKQFHSSPSRQSMCYNSIKIPEIITDITMDMIIDEIPRKVRITIEEVKHGRD